MFADLGEMEDGLNALSKLCGTERLSFDRGTMHARFTAERGLAVLRGRPESDLVRKRIWDLTKMDWLYSGKMFLSRMRRPFR